MTERDAWVPETRFGAWFQRTAMWTDYVVAPAIEDLARFVADRASCFRRILDAGCGHGAAFPKLEQHFRPESVVAVDIDPGVLDEARVKARECSCNVDVRVGNVTQLDLADASVDMVLCHQTLHHASDQEGVLYEFYRVLRPGGVLLISESCRRFIHSIAVRALFRHPKGVQKSAEEYLVLLRSAGFEIRFEDVSTPQPFWSKPDFGLLERLGGPAAIDTRPTMINAAAFRPGGPTQSP